MALYFLYLFIFTSIGYKFPLFYFAINRPNYCSSFLVPKKLPHERSDLRKSTLDIFTCKPIYFSHAAYQSTFVLWRSAPDPLGRPHFLIMDSPFITGCFVVAAVLDVFFVTNDEDKDCCFWFFGCCCVFCGSTLSY